MSDIVNLYRYLLVLPIVFPLVFFALGRLGVIDKQSILAIPAMFVAGSLVIGGLPYLACATYIFWTSKNTNESVVRRLYFLYPLGIIAIFGLVLFVDGLFFNRIDYLAIPPLKFLPDFVNCFLTVSGFTILFGYTYVLITFAVVRVIRSFTEKSKAP